MSSFTGPLVITPAPELGPMDWRVTRRLEAWIGSEAEKLWLFLDEGDHTNLGDVPRPLWPLLPPHDPRFAALFALHDKYCRQLGFSRWIADAIFRELGLVVAREHRIGRWRVELMYAGIRLWVTVLAPIKRPILGR